MSQLKVAFFIVRILLHLKCTQRTKFTVGIALFINQRNFVFVVNVITYILTTGNSYLPDTTWIWDNYKGNVSDIACRLSPSDVCVKYTFNYNNAGK